jgi:MFS family permease
MAPVAVVPNSMPAQPPPDGTPSFPPGLPNAFLFATFNALSFQMILGSPMILFAKSLNASATVLGIIAGMMPLLVIFQIPAANHVARIGYKRFVYGGWGIRVLFIFAMALVPITGQFLNPTSRLALLLFLLFGFNLSRGISSAAWLPWITSLVPVEIRGRYLARDATCVHLASCLGLLLAALALGRTASPWQFSLIFGFSALMGAVSLVFLKRIPDVPPPDQEITAKISVPWIAIASHPPFRKLLHLNVAWSFAYGGMATFTVAFLRTEAGFANGTILLVTGFAFLGGLAGLAWFESRTDRLGSKPVLTFCLLIWILILLGWIAFSANLLAPRVQFVFALHLLMGFAYALVNVNNTRLAMVLAPVMGRSHFFALFSVVGNLTLGLSPILWGLLIDLFGQAHRPLGPFNLNRYSFFFSAALAIFALTLLLSRRLVEPKARNIDELLLEILRSPQRLWLRLWPRG